MQVEEILSRLIQIKSVNPPGGETEVARYLKGLFDEAGIRNEIIESAPGRGSFIAYLGEGSRRLLFLSHTDVVPVTSNWEVDPFSGAIIKGQVWGRGALDCKGLVAAEAHAMLQLAQRRSRLNGQLVFAATADEEVGGTYGVKYLMEHHPEKLRADFALNEGAEAPVVIDGKVVYFIQTGEKGAAWVTLKSKGVSAHGSLPDLGINAVVKMASVIEKLARYKPRKILIPEVKLLIESLSKLFGDNRRVTISSLDHIIDSLPDRTYNAYLRAITRMTVSPNHIQGGVKTNIIPDSCTTEVDIRVLPGQERDFVLNELKKYTKDEIEIDLPDFLGASFSSSKTDGYQFITTTIKNILGEVICLPSMSSGATDSRFLRKHGIPSYGIAVMDKNYDPSLQLTVHGRNERVDMKSLSVQADFFIKVAEAYLGTKS